MLIFVGWDSREVVGFHVFVYSLTMHASRIVSVVPLMQERLRASGIYRRDRNPLESTQFSFTRFLCPYLAGYKGRSIFADGADMLCLADIYKLVENLEPSCDAWCCQHNYTPARLSKMGGIEQTVYPKKNWSSLIVFDNERCKSLTPRYVNEASPSDLHQFSWAQKVGSIPLEWNYLVGEPNQSKEKPRIVHFTNGGPWMKGYENVAYSREWWSAYGQMISPVSPAGIEKATINA